MPPRLLCATDFSERSDRALRRAVLVAQAHQARLDLVHVVDDDRPKRLVDHEAADARALLRRMAQTLQQHDGLRSETEVIFADPFEGLLRAAETRPLLLVLGPHRRQALRDAFIGTTAERVIRKAACPVLTVNAPPAGPYRHILLTTDLSETSAAALQGFLDLGLFPQARHSLLTVFDLPFLRLAMADTLPPPDQSREIAAHSATSLAELARFAAGLRGPLLQPLTRRREAGEAAEILKSAAEIGADLVVMVSQGRSALARMMLGSITQQVLQQAQVDVLTLPCPTSA